MEKPNRLYFSEMLGGFIVFLTSMLAVGPLIATLWLGTENVTRPLQPDMEARLLICIAITTALAMIGYCLCLSRRAKDAIWRQRAFESVSRTSQDFLLGATAWWVAYPIVGVISQFLMILILLLGFPPVHYEQVAVRYVRMTLEYPALFAVMTVALVLLVPIAEEILFRGCLQTWLRHWLRPGQAIVLTSTLFAFFHFSSSQNIDNVPLLASLFLLSCFLGYLYERQQSLWASIGLHGTFNGVSVILILFTEPPPSV